MFSLYTENKQLAIESFRLTLWKARRDAILSKLVGKASGLKRYEAVKPDLLPQKRFLGVMQIPTARVTGTVGRYEDFDGRFRPLKDHLRDRWVGVALQANGAGWLPIEVYKIGDDYYVVDGHHRTSVAHNTGVAFLDAKVWEFSHEPDGQEKQPVSALSAVTPGPVPAPNGLARQPATRCPAAASGSQ